MGQPLEDSRPSARACWLIDSRSDAMIASQEVTNLIGVPQTVA